MKTKTRHTRLIFYKNKQLRYNNWIIYFDFMIFYSTCFVYITYYIEMEIINFCQILYFVECFKHASDCIIGEAFPFLSFSLNTMFGSLKSF